LGTEAETEASVMSLGLVSPWAVIVGPKNYTGKFPQNEYLFFVLVSPLLMVSPGAVRPLLSTPLRGLQRTCGLWWRTSPAGPRPQQSL